MTATPTKQQVPVIASSFPLPARDSTARRGFCIGPIPPEPAVFCASASTPRSPRQQTFCYVKTTQFHTDTQTPRENGTR